MSFSFGVGELSLLENLRLTGCAVTTGTTSGVDVASGACIIDGITCVVSAVTDLTGNGFTGSANMVYAYLSAGDTTTATVAVMSGGHPLNTAGARPTAICPLARFSYGTGGVTAVSEEAVWSGGSATKSMGKVQNVSFNITYETAQMRGGADVFAADTQFFDGNAEGSFEYADFTAQQQTLFGGVYASAAANSGTWTLSATSQPRRVSLVFQTVTNGITATYSLMRAYILSQTLDFSRTEYAVPSVNFVAEANRNGDLIQVQQ